jgi:hypothetical protein
MMSPGENVFVFGCFRNHYNTSEAGVQQVFAAEDGCSASARRAESHSLGPHAGCAGIFQKKQTENSARVYVYLNRICPEYGMIIQE